MITDVCSNGGGQGPEEKAPDQELQNSYMTSVYRTIPDSHSIVVATPHPPGFRLHQLEN